jgi:DNA-binding beta-propeller fold protein YncE
MHTSYKVCLTSALVLIAVTTVSQTTGTPFRLAQTISMPNVKGRLDHMYVDVEGKRLFLAGLENGTLEILDLSTGKWSRRLTGFKKPQGVLYIPKLNKLFVASGDDAMLRVFRGDTLDLLHSIELEPGPNRVIYDPHSDLVYVGYGGKDAGKDYGQVGIIDAKNDKHIGDIKVSAHPSELLLNEAGTTLFVFMAAANQLQVVDKNKRRVVATWSVSGDHPGDAAFDESTSRLFIGTHTPAEMIVMDSQTGTEITHLATAQGMDGVYFDRSRKRVYVSGGRSLPEGFAYIYQQHDADHYRCIGKIPTREGSGTSFWSRELNRYYVAAPATGKQDAAILVYEPQD